MCDCPPTKASLRRLYEFRDFAHFIEVYTLTVTDRAAASRSAELGVPVNS